MENAYEAKRAARIAENRRKMEDLGLLGASRALEPAGQAAKRRAPAPKRPPPPPAEASRASGRLRGHAAPCAAVSDAVARAEAAEDAAAAAAGPPPRCGGRQADVRPPPATAYHAPFSLRVGRTTVWEIGMLRRGADADLYWSGNGSLYRHAHPVGFRAERTVWGVPHEVRIEAGPPGAGPEFVLRELAGGGRVWRGATPTRPWTDACLSRRTGLRISGPAFMGFSDLAVQRAVFALYSAAEAAAALEGRVPQYAEGAGEVPALGHCAL
jgi:hypothetical protein